MTSWGGGLNGHDIFEKIISLENLFLAWQEFKRGKNSKLEIQEFSLNLEDNIFQLHADLKNATYRHSAYTAFYVNDPKLRHIHKASVLDRVLHHAIYRVLYPVFDKNFIYDSYSCRNGKGTHRAVYRLKSFLNKASQNNSSNAFALKCDIRKFFDSVDQNVLLGLIKKKVKDEKTLFLIEEIISSFSKGGGKALPLGNVTSQLFANIYLNEFDQYIKHRLKSKYYIRYCDDFIILDSSQEKLCYIVKEIDQFLKFVLKLELHPNKISIRTYRQGVDFLGYVVLPYHKMLRTKTKNRVLRKINAGVSKKSLQSYLGILKHCNGYGLETKIGAIEQSKKME